MGPICKKSKSTRLLQIKKIALMQRLAILVYYVIRIKLGVPGNLNRTIRSLVVFSDQISVNPRDR
jgi:hypothetical protein